MAGPFPTSTVYTHQFWQPVTCAFYLSSLVLLSALVTRRTPAWGTWKAAGPAKWALLTVLVYSTLFVFCAAFIALGFGTSSSTAACSGAIWLCIGLYFISKVLITWFLIERAFIVHGAHTTRRESKLYKLNLSLMLVWVMVLCVFSAFHSAEIRPSDSSCLIGSSPLSSALGVGADIGVNLYLALLFVFPLWHGNFASSEMRWVAIKSLIAALVAMASSVSNMLIFTLLHGRELSFVCLSACNGDTVLNAVCLFLVTTSDSRTRANSLAAVTSNNTTNPYSLTLKADPVPPLVYFERRALTEAEAVELGEVRTTGTRS